MSQYWIACFTLNGEPPHRYTEVNTLMRSYGGLKSRKITTLFKFRTTSDEIDELISIFVHEFPNGSICIVPTNSDPMVH